MDWICPIMSSAARLSRSSVRSVITSGFRVTKLACPQTSLALKVWQEVHFFFFPFLSASFRFFLSVFRLPCVFVAFSFRFFPFFLCIFCVFHSFCVIFCFLPCFLVFFREDLSSMFLSDFFCFSPFLMFRKGAGRVETLFRRPTNARNPDC